MVVMFRVRGTLNVSLKTFEMFLKIVQTVAHIRKLKDTIVLINFLIKFDELS